MKSHEQPGIGTPVTRYFKMNRALMMTVATGALLAIAVSLYAYSYINTPPASLKEPVTVEIEAGSSFNSIAGMLSEKGVIDDAKRFYIYAKLRGVLQSIKAGEYIFEPSHTTKEVLNKLLEGSVINYRLTIPEGYNIYQIADLLDSKGLAGKEDFIAKAFDEDFLQSRGVNGISFEGYLYPETYFLVKGMSSEEIIKYMHERFTRMFTPEIEERAAELGFSIEEIVNLASIIEKETGRPDERPLISAVFHNRLKKRIKLQSDPTVIYGMLNKFDGDLRKRDLKDKTPYNTYITGGLPAGPIANPGIDSIQAALYPADSDYIYFVSKNDGSHAFAKNLKEHNRNVWKYQKSRIR